MRATSQFRIIGRHVLSVHLKPVVAAGNIAAMYVGCGIRLPATASEPIASGHAAGAYALGTGESAVKLPDQIVWKAPAVTPGPSTAVLYGDPTKVGVYVSRLKIPAGFKIMPHTHPDEWRTAVVVSGTLHFGRGDKWDDAKLQPRPAGTFFTEEKGAPHFVRAKDGEVIVQITGMGPSGTTPIPQK